MNSNLRTLSLALAAMFVLAAMGAGAAQGKFDSEVEHTTFSGEQPVGKPHEFTVEAGTTTCEVATFSGTSVGVLRSSNPPIWTSEDIKVLPHYTFCKTIVLGETKTAHMKMNGCEYTLTAKETTEGSTIVDGTTDIVCPVGAAIDVEITGANICTLTVPAQNNVGGITFHNTPPGGGGGATRDIDVVTHVTELKYTQHGTFCPGNAFSSTKEFNNGKYNGEVTVKGFNTPGAQVGIWVT